MREIRTALSRRQREEQVARQSAEQAMWSELKESVTALLLSCDLALSVPGVPAPAADKLRAMHDLACQIRERPGYRVRLVSGSWLAHICG